MTDNASPLVRVCDKKKPVGLLVFYDQPIQNLTAPSDMRDLGLLPLARPYVP